MICKLKIKNKRHDTCMHCDARQKWADYQCGLTDTYDGEPPTEHYVYQQTIFCYSENDGTYDQIAQGYGYASEKDMYINLLYVRKKTISEICKIVGRHESTIRDRLSRFSIPVAKASTSSQKRAIKYLAIARSLGYEDDVKMFADLYAKYSFAEISVIIGVAGSDVRKRFMEIQEDLSLLGVYKRYQGESK